MTWSTFKELVKELLSDGQRNNATYTLAAAEFVKHKFAREGSQDIAAHDSYLKSYIVQRLRLLGFVYTGTTLAADVKTLISVDANRNPAFFTSMLAQAQADIEGLGPTVDGLIRQAVMDIQSAIPLYRIGQQNTFQRADLTLVGFASQGDVPAGAQIRDGEFINKVSGISGVNILTEGTGYTSAAATISGDGTGAVVTPVVSGGRIVGIDINERGQNYTSATIAITGDGTGATGSVVLGVVEAPLRPWDWSHRDQLIAGKAPINGKSFYLCIDPYSKTFLVFPHVDDMHKVVLTWDGLKSDFIDADTVPFDEPVAQAVAEWVRGHLAKSLKVDQVTYMACLRPAVGSYYVARRQLYLGAQDRTRMRNA